MKIKLLATLILGIAIGVYGSSAVQAGLKGSGIFSDVRSGTYYDDAVGEVYDAGIITGYDDGRFGPDDFVTRGQVAVMMQRFLNRVEGGSSTTTKTTTKKESSSSSSKASTTTESTSDTSTDTSSSNRRGTFRLTTTSFSISEGAPQATVSVVRTGGADGPVSLTYATSEGTATAGEDYTEYEGTLSFADGESSKTISVTIKEDEVAEENETITVTLKDPVGGADIESSSNVLTITILDNDAAASTPTVEEAGDAGAFTFSARAYAIAETTDTITITVERISGSKGEATVEYQANPGSAGSSNFTETSGTLTFPDGKTEKTFDVAIKHDTGISGNKTVNLKLLNPTGDAVLSSGAESTLTIKDVEVVTTGSGSVQFDESEYEINEGDVAEILVVRQSGSIGEVTIDYETTNGTAKSSNDDYVSTSGTLTFKEGEVEKVFLVQTEDDTLNEPTETVQLTLSNVSGGTLGSKTSATLNILD